MLSIRQISGFVLRAVIVFTILVAAWRGVGGLYAGYVQTLGSSLFGTLRGDLEIEFSPIEASLPERWQPPEGQDWDVQITITSRQPPHDIALFFNKSRNLGYVPTAFVVALTLATPIPWSRRWRSVVWGLVCVNVLVGLKTLLLLGYGIEFASPFGLMSTDSWLRNLLGGMHEVVVHGAGGGRLLFPVLIWILVTVRRADLRRFTRELTKSEPQEC